jgi:hypothetical protein
MAWPAENPASNSKGGLLASLALGRGITNFSTLSWQAGVEVLLQNLLQNSPPQVGFSSFGKTLTSLGTTQASTPTAAQVVGGILTQTGAVGAGTCTLPIGTLLAAALPVAPSAGATFQVLFMNVGGAQDIVITGDTGTTVSGTATVPSGKSCILTFVATSASAFNCYCTLSA